MTATTTLTAPPNASREPVRDAWVNRLFERFSLMYGRDWSDKWTGIPMTQVKASWAMDLAPFTADDIRRALEEVRTHNKFPPSCPEFVTLCRVMRPAPVPKFLALPEPRGGAIAPHVQAEIDKLLDAHRTRDPKDWAREILREHQAGTYRLPIGVQMARQALRV